MDYQQRVTITPELATKYLIKNKGNRNLSMSHVNNLRRQLVDGDWIYNGESIKFDVDGNLLDGQHRLEACKYAQVSFISDIAYNMSKEAFKTIDTGKKRTPSQCLSIAGYKNTCALSVGIRLVFYYDAGGRDLIARGKISNNQTLRVMNNYQDLPKSISLAQTLYKKSGGFLSIGYLGGLHFMFSRINKTKADSFIHAYASGANLNEGSPILALRRKLQNMTSETAKTKPSSGLKAAYMIVAWLSYVKDGELTRLHLKGDKLPDIG